MIEALAGLVMLGIATSVFCYHYGYRAGFESCMDRSMQAMDKLLDHVDHDTQLQIEKGLDACLAELQA